MNMNRVHVVVCLSANVYARTFVSVRSMYCARCTVYGAVLVSVYTFCLAFFIKLKIWFTFCSSTFFEINTQNMNKRIFFTIHFYQSHSWSMQNNLVYFIFQFHFFLLQCINLHKSSVFVYHFFPHQIAHHSISFASVMVYCYQISIFNHVRFFLDLVFFIANLLVPNHPPNYSN